MQVILDVPEMNVDKEQIKLLLAIKLFEEEMLSLGKAAEVAGYSEYAFSEILLKKGIAPIKYEDLDLTEEPGNA
jgi:predicted HTH domain antitoxin